MAQVQPLRGSSRPRVCADLRRLVLGRVGNRSSGFARRHHRRGQRDVASRSVVPVVGRALSCRIGHSSSCPLRPVACVHYMCYPWCAPVFFLWAGERAEFPGSSGNITCNLYTKCPDLIQCPAGSDCSVSCTSRESCQQHRYVAAACRRRQRCGATVAVLDVVARHHCPSCAALRRVWRH
jgi:hypothetical protein